MDPVSAQRLAALPPYLFVEIDRKRDQARAAGRDIIDLGVGDPDLPTPQFIVERMREALGDPDTHRYPPGTGLPALREHIAAWFRTRFDVVLDPSTEILVLIGSKEGLGHLPLAVVDPGQTVLVPDPGYPVYHAASLFAGATPHPMPLRPDHAWLPDLAAVPPAVLPNTRLMFVNYPNNPTAAVADLAAFQNLVAFAGKHNILIAQDAAYSETYFERPPPSILQVPGAKEVAVEFHSLSKTFSMTGWRVGFAVGNPKALQALAQTKSNLDSGVFAAVQWAALEALRHADHPDVLRLRHTYRRRRDVFCSGLCKCGFELAVPEATFYVWCRCPAGYGSMESAARILDQANVVLVPGLGFGQGGEGWLRAALTVPQQRLEEAVDRIGRLSL